MNYRNWINRELKALDSAPPDPGLDYFGGLRLLVADCERLAAKNALPLAVAACQIRPGPIAVPTARRILSACLSHCPPDPLAQWLSIRQAAAHLQMSESGVRKLVRSGKIRFSQGRKGAPIRFRVQWLDAYREPNAPSAPSGLL
jgi:excisionase family DNA binding protein